MHSKESSSDSLTVADEHVKQQTEAARQDYLSANIVTANNLNEFNENIAQIIPKNDLINEKIQESQFPNQGNSNKEQISQANHNVMIIKEGEVRSEYQIQGNLQPVTSRKRQASLAHQTSTGSLHHGKQKLSLRDLLGPDLIKPQKKRVRSSSIAQQPYGSKSGGASAGKVFSHQSECSIDGVALNPAKLLKETHGYTPWQPVEMPFVGQIQKSQKPNNGENRRKKIADKQSNLIFDSNPKNKKRMFIKEAFQGQLDFAANSQGDLISRAEAASSTLQAYQISATKTNSYGQYFDNQAMNPCFQNKNRDSITEENRSKQNSPGPRSPLSFTPQNELIFAKSQHNHVMNVRKTAAIFKDSTSILTASRHLIQNKDRDQHKFFMSEENNNLPNGMEKQKKDIYAIPNIFGGTSSEENNVFDQLAIDQGYASSTVNDGVTSSSSSISEDSCSEPLISASSKKASKCKVKSNQKENLAQFKLKLHGNQSGKDLDLDDDLSNRHRNSLKDFEENEKHAEICLRKLSSPLDNNTNEETADGVEIIEDSQNDEGEIADEDCTSRRSLKQSLRSSLGQQVNEIIEAQNVTPLKIQRNQANNEKQEIQIEIQNSLGERQENERSSERQRELQSQEDYLNSDLYLQDQGQVELEDIQKEIEGDRDKTSWVEENQESPQSQNFSYYDIPDANTKSITQEENDQIINKQANVLDEQIEKIPDNFVDENQLYHNSPGRVKNRISMSPHENLGVEMLREIDSQIQANTGDHQNQDYPNEEFYLIPIHQDQNVLSEKSESLLLNMNSENPDSQPLLKSLEQNQRISLGSLNGTKPFGQIEQSDQQQKNEDFISQNSSKPIGAQNNKIDQNQSEEVLSQSQSQHTANNLILSASDDSQADALQKQIDLELDKAVQEAFRIEKVTLCGGNIKAWKQEKEQRKQLQSQLLQSSVSYDNSDSSTPQKQKIVEVLEYRPDKVIYSNQTIPEESERSITNVSMPQESATSEINRLKQQSLNGWKNLNVEGQNHVVEQITEEITGYEYHRNNRDSTPIRNERSQSQIFQEFKNNSFKGLGTTPNSDNPKGYNFVNYDNLASIFGDNHQFQSPKSPPLNEYGTMEKQDDLSSLKDQKSGKLVKQDASQMKDEHKESLNDSQRTKERKSLDKNQEQSFIDEKIGLELKQSEDNKDENVLSSQIDLEQQQSIKTSALGNIFQQKKESIQSEQFVDFKGRLQLNQQVLLAGGGSESRHQGVRNSFEGEVKNKTEDRKEKGVSFDTTLKTSQQINKNKNDFETGRQQMISLSVSAIPGGGISNDSDPDFTQINMSQPSHNNVPLVNQQNYQVQMPLGVIQETRQQSFDPNQLITFSNQVTTSSQQVPIVQASQTNVQFDKDSVKPQDLKSNNAVQIEHLEKSQERSHSQIPFTNRNFSSPLLGGVNIDMSPFQLSIMDKSEERNVKLDQLITSAMIQKQNMHETNKEVLARYLSAFEAKVQQVKVYRKRQIMLEDEIRHIESENEDIEHKNGKLRWELELERKRHFERRKSLEDVTHKLQTSHKKVTTLCKGESLKINKLYEKKDEQIEKYTLSASQNFSSRKLSTSQFNQTSIISHAFQVKSEQLSKYQNCLRNQKRNESIAKEFFEYKAAQMTRKSDRLRQETISSSFKQFRKLTKDFNSISQNSTNPMTPRKDPLSLSAHKALLSRYEPESKQLETLVGKAKAKRKLQERQSEQKGLNSSRKVNSRKQSIHVKGHSDPNETLTSFYMRKSQSSSHIL